MAKMVNYGDSLFLVGEMVRTLKDAVRLEIEATLFFDKLVEDVFFVETTLDKLNESLRSSSFLIDRSEHLKNLMRTENLYADLLDDLRRERCPLAEELRPFAGRFELMSKARRERANDIRRIIEDSEPNLNENGDMISPAEYEFLLVDSENPGEDRTHP